MLGSHQLLILTSLSIFCLSDFFSSICTLTISLLLTFIKFNLALSIFIAKKNLSKGRKGQKEEKR